MSANITLIDKLTTDSIKSVHFNALYQTLSIAYADSKLKIPSFITSKKTDDLCRYADIFSLSEESEYRVLAYRIIVKLLGVSEKKPALGSMARSIFTKLGLFFSESRFDKDEHPLPYEREVSNILKRDRQKLPFGNEVFTDSQYEVFTSLTELDNFSFSGPTSFGKSFIIRSYIFDCISNKKNVVILVPTKVLIEEYIREIRKTIKVEGWGNVNLSKNAQSYIEDKINILILTPERFNNLIYTDLELSIDVLVVDEAHKLGDDDERSMTSFKVIQETRKRLPTCKVIFSSPVISNPSVFLESFGLDGRNSIEAIEGPVTQNLFFIDLLNNSSQFYNEVSKEFYTHTKELKIEDMFSFIRSVTSKSSLIYCTSKSGSVSDAVLFAEDLPLLTNPKLVAASKNIKELIHEEYFLSDLLLKGVAFHNADLPKNVRSIIESLYQSREIAYLFCTSTLLEGVNLPTGNLFLRSFKTRGKITNKTKLDFWNLAGRAGRYTKELDGNIFCMRDTSSSWGNISTLVEKKNEVKADTSALKRLMRGRKIINVLKDGPLNEEKQERIMDQISNMILSDYMENKQKNHPSSLMNLVPKKFHSGLFKVLEDKLRDSGINEVPRQLFAIGHNISIERHINVLSDIKEQPVILSSLNGSDTYPLFERVCKVYKLKFSTAQINRLYRIAQQWIHGFSLKDIINNSLDNCSTVVIYRGGPIENFDRTNKAHVNAIINGVISSIEHDIGYELELYINHYYQHLVNSLGSEGAGINLSTYLELGTNDKFEISLQNYGFSRSVASELIKFYKEFIKFDDENVVVSIDTVNLLARLGKNSIAFTEVGNV
ncbi:ATP-dependent RNA helicase, DEAD box family protein [Psychromonas ingrahamii 37]|uniref:ATP-dependent RNA helicase, DEAD box family protein n=1 Tax=Psychromonas ingrahamii (strain DSM 17664 / CCUG 51855 / 37) TaxID=357804 RepID=A1SZ94_PSYIN|nr:DEAD/DEAH box helicase [Psychromonas ingrahamii]ABM04809.1 ATP-dependent RNA helicase, DEAD box family protein [Psychromonas ingrahamii 37]